MNTQSRTPTRSPTRVKALVSLHRYTGLAIALPVFLLVLTGIPLQFTDTLQLGRMPVTINWVLDSYAISSPDEALVSEDFQHLNDVLLTPTRVVPLNDPPVGMIHRELVTVVATADSLLLIPTDADIPVETLGAPGQVDQLGFNHSEDLVIDTPEGLLQTPDYGATWLKVDPFTDSFYWSRVESRAASNAWQIRYRSQKLSWERWLQDLHSGRFFGPVGEWIMSLASLALILLAITGAIVWLRRRPAKTP